MRVPDEYIFNVNKFLTFFTKLKGKNGIVPFKPNYIQTKLFEVMNNSEKLVILKARQMGCSTGICGYFFHDTITRRGINSVIVAQKEEDATELFEKNKLMYESMPEKFRPKKRYSNKQELVFDDIDSYMRILSASGTGGRSRTINNLLCTELPLWRNVEDRLTSLMDAVPKGNGKVVIESTPGANGDYFHNLWLEAKENRVFTPVFFEWWHMPEYRWIHNCGCKICKDVFENGNIRLTDEEKMLATVKRLDFSQILWRRHKITEKRNRDLFLKDFPEDDVHCFIQAGRPRFDAEFIKITCQEKEPEADKTYVIGADTSEGLVTGDYCSADVICRQTGEQVKSLHGHWPPDIFGQKLADLGKHYNNAQIAVERNNHGHAVLLKLKSLYYPHIWYFMDSKPGWNTTSRTKPQMIDALDEWLRDGSIKLSSQKTCEELMSYQIEDDGKTNAPQGMHDDRVISLAIAIQALSRRLVG